MIWKTPSSPIILKENTLHLWYASLDIPDSEINRLANYLSPDEIAKANRFHFDQHRRRYLVSRGILRQILAQYLTLKPQHIQFNYSDKGKPFLDLPNRSQPLQFNLSHSEEIALYGISKKEQIGVDIEKIRPMKDVEGIAKRFFTPKEGALIEALERNTKIKAFFQLWTAKEAYLKAIGAGIAGGLEKVEIQWNRSKVEGILPHNSAEDTQASWELISFSLKEDYIGAVAIEKQNPELQCFIANLL